MTADRPPVQRTHVTTLAEVERVADAHDVGVTRVGGSYYAVVVDRATDTVEVYQAYAAEAS